MHSSAKVPNKRRETVSRNYEWQDENNTSSQAQLLQRKKHNLH